MEILASLIVAVLFACGAYLVLRARTFPVALGLALLSYGVNLFLFFTGRLVTGAPLWLGSLVVLVVVVLSGAAGGMRSITLVLAVQDWL